MDGQIREIKGLCPRQKGEIYGIILIYCLQVNIKGLLFVFCSAGMIILTKVWAFIWKVDWSISVWTHGAVLKLLTHKKYCKKSNIGE